MAASDRLRLHPGKVAGGLGLLWLAWPVAALLGDDAASTARRAWVLAVVAVVVAVVLKEFLEPDADEPPGAAHSARVVGLLVASDVVLSLGDRPAWAAILSVYALAFGVMALPGRRGLALCALGSAGAFALMVAAGSSAADAGTQTLTVAGVSVTLLAVGAVVRANDELRAARAELARAAVADERDRFARDLHDLLGHSLSLIAIKARLAQRVAAQDPERAAAEVADIERAARTALAEVREAVTGYRRATIAGELVGARAALRSAGVEMDARVTRMALDAEDEAVLAWALREATTNVVRHADEARSVTVRLEPDGAGARLLVQDDGRGAPGDPGEGSGLRGLAERVARRDGALEAGRAPDEHGFRLTVTLPGGAAA